ncbi:MAG: transglutaminase [Candidatus Omnitrophica bacterium CG11_big_fil_rev_8_21_14_0_20_63_9]|nr:MAG: transglutaminase [Candidatus Omnitrophica bacterium CG11_big_fil_rev_8_21_14_0_20_63_9]
MRVINTADHDIIILMMKHADIRAARWLVIMPVAVVSVWLAADRGHTAAIMGPGDAGPREVLFTYVARLPQIPSGAQDIRVWIPLAKTGREQRIMRREVRSPVPYTITEDPEHGNEMLHLSLHAPAPPQLEVVVDYGARLWGGDPGVADHAPTPEELSRDVQARGLVIIDEEVRARARQATAGRSTLTDRARGIYEAVLRQVAYDKSVPGWGHGDTRRVCLLGKGNCTDFHSLFISMARASQVPARFKIGVVIPQEASGTIPGYHCWAEFYEPGQGWVPVDASEAWKHPELADYYFGARDGNRLLLSVGRDIQLMPRQHGEPINIFFYPYVEVDGREFPGVETKFRFHDLQPGRTG